MKAFREPPVQFYFLWTETLGRACYLIFQLEILGGPLLYILRKPVFCLFLFFLNPVLKLSYKYKNRWLGRTIYFNTWSLKPEIRPIVFFQVCDFS